MTQQPMTYHIVITSSLNQLLHYLFILTMSMSYKRDLNLLVRMF